MFKFKHLLILSLLMHCVMPAQGSDFWGHTKKIMLKNSGKIGLVIVAAAVAYYFLMPDDKPKTIEKEVPSAQAAPEPGTWASWIQKTYRNQRLKTNQKNKRYGTIFENSESEIDSDVE